VFLQTGLDFGVTHYQRVSLHAVAARVRHDVVEPAFIESAFSRPQQVQKPGLPGQQVDKCIPGSFVVVEGVSANDWCCVGVLADCDALRFRLPRCHPDVECGAG